MDIRQDPNAIPDFGNGGRIGELQPDAGETRQSSVQLDPAPEHEPPVAGEDAPPAVVVPDPSTAGPGAIDGLVGAP